MQIDLQRKLAGILVPIFALRSNKDLGIGDIGCVREMISWCAQHEFSVLQILPINETGNDNSPYNAISSMALDPTIITITPEEIPELSSGSFRKLVPSDLLEELCRGPVLYHKVKPLKLELLRKAFAQFLKKHHAKGTKRAREFRAFMAANKNWLADYTLFRTLMQIHHDLPIWEKWPSEHQTPARAQSWILSQPASEQRELKKNMMFFSYVQWLAYQQWMGLKQYGEQQGVFLMGDIPFCISRHSADVWGNCSLFDLRWSSGAPPETFFKPDLFTERWGQNWGMPLYRWNFMEEDDCAWWRARVRKAAEIFHFFRIDHALGFYRIYAFPWQPEDNHLYMHLSQEEARARAGDLPRFWPNDDNDPHQRQMNQQQGEKLLHMVLDAAGTSVVVAEDLGMVPDYVRPSLARLGIPGFKIPLFERHPDGSYKNSDEYQSLSVATLATHDHEPVAAFWNRWQITPKNTTETNHFLNWIGWNSVPPPHEFTRELHAAVAGKLLASPSWLVVFMISDLFARTQRFNVPGPMNDSNWTERLSMAVEEFDKDPGISACVRMVESHLPR